jgi:hypothetical protein
MEGRNWKYIQPLHLLKLMQNMRNVPLSWLCMGRANVLHAKKLITEES